MTRSTRTMSLAAAMAVAAGPGASSASDPSEGALRAREETRAVETPAAPRPDLRPFVIGMETGWNGLTGMGAAVSWRPSPRLAIDGAAGFGAVSPKGGVSVRYIAGDGRARATAGVGLQLQGPFDGEVAEAPGPPWPLLLYVGLGSGTGTHIGTTALVQLVGGLQVRGGGLDMTALFGWSQVVAGHHVRSDGPLNADQRSWIRDVTGSGPVVTFTFGIAPGR